MASAPGRNLTLFATNDDAHRTAVEMQAAGLRVAAVIDSRTGVEKRGDYRLIEGGQVVTPRAATALRQITVSHGGRTEDIVTDCLAMSGGWNPSVHLTCHLGARPVWDADAKAFLPAPGAVPGMIPPGACNGAMSTSACLSEGKEAAKEALKTLGLSAKRGTLPKASDDAGTGDALWFVEGKGRAWLDFANDVTTKDVKLAAQEGFTSVEHMKRYTTQGMAPDQGKSSNIAALALLADTTGRGIPETGTTTYRPPFIPVSIGAMAAGAEQKGFAPERFTTSDRAAILGRADDRRGAVVPPLLPAEDRGRRTGASPATARCGWCARRWASSTSRRWARSTYRGRTRRSSSTSSIATCSRR
jgi:hypothetical protein